jgi:RHS repeat-associated protein
MSYIKLRHITLFVLTVAINASVRAGGLILRDGVPYIWQFDGGYVSLNANGTPTSWNYYITDHLGSTRKVVDSNNNVKETINYYPFGSEMKMQDPAQMAGDTWQQYRFTGKELDNQNGLNWYDFGARWYDVAGVPMWTSVDPLAEKYYPYSPYNYCLDNPVKNIDPDGRAVETGWDIINVGLDITSLSHNVINGNVGAAVVDGLCLVADVAATAMPFVPGGAGTAIKAARTAEKAVNATKSVGKSAEAAKMAQLRQKAEIGQEAHRQIEREIVKNNPGAKVEQTIRLGKNQKVRKDVVLADGKTVIIIKPNTKSGQKAAQKRFDLMKKNGYKPQKVFYNPNDPKYLPGSPTYIGPKKN